MKKQTIKSSLVLALLCALSFSAWAQDGERTHVLKTNVLGYFAGQFQMAYEHGINENISVQLSAGFLTGSSSSSIFGAEYESKRSGVILIPEVRYYFGGEAPRRFYAGAFARYRFANNALTDKSWVSGGAGTNQDLSRDGKVNSIGGGALLGYQVITRGGFTFDIFAGPQYKSRTQKTVYDNTALNVSTTSGYENLGDELFASKFLDFSIDDKAGMGLRFGFNFGYAF